MKIVITVILIVLIWIVTPSNSNADISVLGGLTREFDLSPGARYEGIIQIANGGADDVLVNVFQTDYMFDFEGKTIYGELGGIKRSNAGWLSFSPSRLMIPAREKVSLYFTINVPDDMDLTGTYWSVFMVEPDPGVEEPDIREREGQIAIGVRSVIRYAIQIITNIGDTGESSVAILSSRMLTSDGKVLFQADIENTGERYLSPTLWMELYDKDGALAGRFESDRKRIFPACSVRHHLDLTGVPKGSYMALLIVDNGDDDAFATNYEIRIE